MTDFLQLCFAGLALGSRYALVALGFVIIFKATGVINFAQGALVTLGAYLTFNFHQTWGLAVRAVAGAGRGRRRAGRRRDRSGCCCGAWSGRPVFAVIMITIGLLFLIDEVIAEHLGLRRARPRRPVGHRHRRPSAGWCSP